MGPPKNAVRSISQEAFDELVKENIDDLGMEPAEALQDAIETLTLQGVDLSGMASNASPFSLLFTNRLVSRENWKRNEISLYANAVLLLLLWGRLEHLLGNRLNCSETTEQ